MSAPTDATRRAMYERDGHRCVSCGRPVGLEHQHRAAVGMGGSKIRPTIEESLTSCALCNPEYEGSLQARALACGWKVRRWVRDHTRVPVFYWAEAEWYELTRDGRRIPISPLKADRMMHDVYGDQFAEYTKAMVP